MAETAEAGTETAPATTGAAPAPGTTDQGQADGSPPAEGTPTSGGNGTQPSKAEVELRRALTSKSEELKRATTILNAAMETDEWKAVDARLRGGESGPSRVDELEAKIYGEDPANLAVIKEYREALLEAGENRALARLRPVVAEVGQTRVAKVIEKALKAEGVAAGEDFDTFRADYEAENEGFSELMGKHPGTGAKMLASAYSIAQKRAERFPAGNRSDPAVERGGGAPGAIRAATQVKLNRKDPQYIHKLYEVVKNGQTPVYDD